MLPNTDYYFSLTFIVSSANVFNLDKSENLLFGREFKKKKNENEPHCGKRGPNDCTGQPGSILYADALSPLITEHGLNMCP